MQGWGFIAPHGEVSPSGTGSTPTPPLSDVTRMVAALQKYGPAQIGIDASCVSGYTGGIITNCTSRNVDHAVAIVGAGTDAKIGVDYWIVRNSWNTTFGEDGYFRVQRDTNQMDRAFLADTLPASIKTAWSIPSLCRFGSIQCRRRLKKI